MTDLYHVVRRTLAGDFICVICGMGRNIGTLDAGHSRRTTIKWAKRCQAEDPDYQYVVEDQFGAQVWPRPAK